jgi:hypothetical protein
MRGKNSTKRNSRLENQKRILLLADREVYYISDAETNL